MAKETYELSIEGLKRDYNLDSLAEYSGVYFVFTSIYDKAARRLILHKLIYIGEAENIRELHKNHHYYDLFVKELNEDEILCYKTARIDDDEARHRIQAAFIFEHKPEINDDFKYNFPFDETRIICTGKTVLISKDFTVQRTE